MKKDYIKPQFAIEELDLRDCLLGGSDYIHGGKDEGDVEGDINDTKDREDSEWGGLW